MFILLIFLAAFALEVIGSYISVLGLAAIFASNIIIMVMAVILDFAKIVTVSFVYRNWDDINKMMRAYMLAATVVLMSITSAGAFGYLSAEFQNAVVPNKEATIKLQALTEEQGRLQARKIEIDKQIANIPANIVRNRIKLIDSFKEETTRINKRLNDIDSELPALKIENVTKNAHIGPIAYVAEAFDVSMEKAVKHIILLIIFVFDPLAIALILAGNFLIEQRKKKDSDPTQKLLSDLGIEVGRNFDTEKQRVPQTHFIPEPETVSATENNWEPVPLPPEEIQAIVELETVDEPKSKIRTEKQLDKIFEGKYHTKTDDMIPAKLLKEPVKEEFTSKAEDDKITPLKGIMSSAATNHMGSEISFDNPGSSTNIAQYR